MIKRLITVQTVLYSGTQRFWGTSENLLIWSNLTSPEDFYEEDLQEYIVYLRDVRKNQPGSVNIRLKALRTFFYYLADKKFKIKLLKDTKKILPTFSEEDIKKLIAKPDKKKVTFAHYRD
jgi:integrase/recombinase XerD